MPVNALMTVPSLLSESPSPMPSWALTVADVPLLEGDRTRFGLKLPVHGWRGESGAWLAHTVFPVARVGAVYGPGNYILARRRADGHFDPLYIGEADDLPSRLDGHERWEAALAMGMSHVHVHHLARGRSERLAVEADLRRRFHAPLNDAAVQIPVGPTMMPQF